MTTPPLLTIALEKVDFLPANRVTDNRIILTLKSLVPKPMLHWQDGKILPGLFLEWSLDETGCRWSLRLAPDKVFHDGTKVQAAHAAAFIDHILQSHDIFGMRLSHARPLSGRGHDHA